MTKAYQTLVDAQAATGLSDRELVFVAGTTAVGDAGQGHFVYRSAATGTASIDVIVVTAGGRLLRVTDPADAIAADIATAVDTALRASALPVSGATGATASEIDTALKATAQPVSAASLPLPSGAAIAANQATASEIDTALKSSPQPVTFPTSTGLILSLTTSATGANFVAFGSAACAMMTLVNESATDIEFRRDGIGASIKVATGGSRDIYGLTNANQIDVRRVDTSDTQVTIKADTLT